MKASLFLFALPFLFSSCLVVKIYESPQANVEDKGTPKRVYHKMIGTGQTIDLGEKGSNEILFFGEDNSPKKFLFESKDSEAEEVSDSIYAWTPKPSDQKILLVTKGDQPLFCIDGVISDHPEVMNTIDPDRIESVHVLKGEAAIKKYGAKGTKGVVEITLKKE